jgi:tRNA pseudouridine32 synthase / 23S rRNA pseudouridine746 synthase
MRASRVYLPKFEFAPSTILEYLLSRFPHISPDLWRARVERGLVSLADGSVVSGDSPYRHGLMVYYQREVCSEAATLEPAVIIYQDGNILIADKPHGMPVTPAGEYVERSLLVSLDRMTGLASLAPMHRLDRDTAGLVLFATNPDARARYHGLFAERLIEREYIAVAYVEDQPHQKQWQLKNRIAAGEPWFRRRIVEGPANTSTSIELVEMRDNVGLFRLTPQTGKKHQIRVHMASLGFPIVGDLLYPQIREKQDGDPPLQLLAKRLCFRDPLSGAMRSYVSGRELEAARS